MYKLLDTHHLRSLDAVLASAETSLLKIELENKKLRGDQHE